MKLEKKYQSYNDLIKKHQTMKEEYRYMNNYKHKVITQTGYLEKELEHFREDFNNRQMNTCGNYNGSGNKNTRNSNENTLKTEENHNTNLDRNKQIEELEIKISELKVSVAETKEKMDNVNDDNYHYEKLNKTLKSSIKNQEIDLDELKNLIIHLKSEISR